MKRVTFSMSPAAFVVLVLALVSASLGSAVVGAKVTASQLANNSVTSAKIKNGQVKKADLASNAVTSAKIMNGQVKKADLASNAVTSAKIMNGQVKAADLASNAVTGAKIKDGTVEFEDLSAAAKDALTYEPLGVNVAFPGNVLTVEHVSSPRITSVARWGTGAYDVFISPDTRVDPPVGVRRCAGVGSAADPNVLVVVRTHNYSSRVEVFTRDRATGNAVDNARFSLVVVC